MGKRKILSYDCILWTHIMMTRWTLHHFANSMDLNAANHPPSSQQIFDGSCLNLKLNLQDIPGGDQYNSAWIYIPCMITLIRDAN